MPIILYLYHPGLGSVLPLVMLSIILHFNLLEITQKQWDDVFCYGLAQSWCLYPFAGIKSGLVALSWLTVVLWSNQVPERYKLKWDYAEIAHGLVIGLVSVM